MNNNIYGIDLGTCNFKVFCKATGKIMKEKNTVAIINKNQIYAYGDAAYAMHEKAPESIQVTFPVNRGVIADFDILQSMLQAFLEKNNAKKIIGRMKKADDRVKKGGPLAPANSEKMDIRGGKQEEEIIRCKINI